jgi:hypothetical protein
MSVEPIKIIRGIDGAIVDARKACERACKLFCVTVA